MVKTVSKLFRSAWRLKTRVPQKKAILFSLLCLLVFFLFIEGGLRVVGFRYEGFRGRASWWLRWNNQLYTADPLLFWKLTPSIDHHSTPGYMKIDSFGFRDREITLAKPEKVYRIFTLGDSCTFGDGVSNEQTYAKVAERTLRERLNDPDIEVINAGVPGYTSYQVLNLFKTKILDFHPDGITVYVGINDGFLVRSGTSDIERGRRSARAWFLRKYFARSRAYQLMEYVVLRHISGQASPPVDFMNESDGLAQAKVVPRVEREEFLSNMTSIKTLCKKSGMEMLMLTSPKRGDQSTENGSNQFIRDVSKTEAIPFIDLFRELKAEENGGIELYDTAGGHPNVRGHEIIGELIADWYLPKILAKKKVAQP